MKVILLSGAAGAGKSTLATALVRNHGFLRSSFAAPLKQAAAIVFGFSHAQLYGPSEARNRPDPRFPRADGTCLTPREALQKLGTEVGRQIYPRVWIDAARRMAEADEPAGGAGLLVFDDARFQNELFAFADVGALLVRIVRPGAGLAGDAGAHQSERELGDLPDAIFDVVVRNDGSLSALDEAARYLAGRCEAKAATYAAGRTAVLPRTPEAAP
jgi:hypothetical protein